MKKSILSILALTLISSQAFANFELSKSRKSILCTGEDGFEIILNGRKTSVTLKAEEVASGKESIHSKMTNSKNYASYISPSGTLTLSEMGDTFQPTGGNAESLYILECKEI